MLNPEQITNLTIEVTSGDNYEVVKYEGVVYLPIGTMQRVAEGG